MRTNSTTGVAPRTFAPVVLGLMLAVGTSVPAHADSARSEQWHLDVMKADEMWQSSTGKGVTVAVIDTGVDTSNPDLAGRILEGLDLETKMPGDEHVDYKGHGTGMAGLISGTGRALGGNGAFGLAPGVKILPIRMPKAGQAANRAAGDARFNESLTKAIKYAVDHDAKVINVSLGVSTGSDELSGAVKYALDKGALVFAAVGNTGDGSNVVEYPAGTPGVIGVGAVGRDLQKTEESQYGSQVDISAPGEEMIHACGGETGFCESHGTSDASAIASASAALIWSKYPDWTNNQVLRVMLNTAGGPINGDERTDYIGYGIVRPRIALKTPGDPGPADEYPLPDLAAAASPTPSAEPPKAAGGAEESDASDKPAAAAPAADDESGGSSTGLWIGVGVGAAVLVGAAASFAAVRSRRRKAVAVAPPPYAGQQAPSPYPHQQTQSPYPPYGTPGAQDPHSPYADPPSQGGGPTR
ncbi:type VII secretion-associated serine protease mycosin [Streptomyces sp. B1I3]|uniref:type VII secretion-associated serine protease mycosin n=1 Tax=Streptomyces sp. B1I3 TaxID=3042264 RepID=UPI00277D4966|nr:type VII secretion-associated serine protease mycosin [Streptomyces sp. B1I3]MDQ0796103.1 type VII secretion-associated serine protease mycosin [Streptomyces sp. B1I3]